MNEKTLKDFTDDIVHRTSKNWYVVCNVLIEQNENLKKEKQDLIKYLEDKIKEELSNIIVDSEEQAIHKNARVHAFKEVLDKIKEGNYE